VLIANKLAFSNIGFILTVEERKKCTIEDYLLPEEVAPPQLTN